MVRFAVVPVLILGVSLASEGAAEEQVAEIIAVQVRDQGHPCEDAKTVERDPKASRPGEEAWILHCSNATYRVRLVPDMDAHIERIE